MQVLTDSEKLLLSSVGCFTILLTALVIVCLVRKSCWLHQTLWEDEKKKKGKMDDIICIRYPPDIYPTSLGMFKENMFRSPDEETNRLFFSNMKRDSTYSSMSEASGSGSSGGLELSSPRNSSGSNTTAISSPVTGASNMSPPLVNQTQTSPIHRDGRHTMNIIHHQVGLAPRVPLPVIPVVSPIPVPGQDQQRRASMPILSSTNRTSASALAEQMAHQRLSLQHGGSSSLLNPKQPFFTFILKYEEENNLVHIEFIEARNLPPKEYVNQPSDAFFTVEVTPKKPVDRKKEVLRYRFVTKTVKKAEEVLDFSETFLAQLAKSQLKEYIIRFSAFDQDRFGNPTEIGSTTLAFDDFKDFASSKLVLSCSLKEPVLKRGNLMIGLCYLPTAERMSVTIGKLNGLNPCFGDGGIITKESVCYVRLLLLRGDTGKVIRKKKTTFQKISGSNNGSSLQSFDETIVFDMPPTELIQTVLLVLVCVTDRPPISKRRGNYCPSTHVQLETDSRESRRRSSFMMMLPSDDSSIFHYAETLINKARRLDSNSSNGSQDTRSFRSKQSTTSVNSSNSVIHPHSTNPVNNENVDTSSETGTNCGVDEKPQRVKDTVVGKVALGYCIRNPLGKFHFENMMRAPRTVATEWHALK